MWSDLWTDLWLEFSNEYQSVSQIEDKIEIKCIPIRIMVCFGFDLRIKSHATTDCDSNSPLFLETSAN